MGAIAGLVAGFLLNVLLWLQKAPLHLGHAFQLPVIAYPWYVPIGSMATFAVGYGASLVTGGTRGTGKPAGSQCG